MENVQTYLPVISLIIAAAAVIVGPMISLKISKDHRDISLKLATKHLVAPMRQVWIESLRDKVSEFLSLSFWYYVSGLHDHAISSDAPDYEAEEETQQSKADRKLSFLATQIELMLNPEEADHIALIEHLKNCRYSAFGGGVSAEFPDHHEAAKAQCKKILKREWERVKNEI